MSEALHTEEKNGQVVTLDGYTYSVFRRQYGVEIGVVGPDKVQVAEDFHMLCEEFEGQGGYVPPKEKAKEESAEALAKRIAFRKAMESRRGRR